MNVFQVNEFSVCLCVYFVYLLQKYEHDCMRYVLYTEISLNVLEYSFMWNACHLLDAVNFKSF